MNCTFLFCLEFCCLCFPVDVCVGFEEDVVDVGQDIVKDDDCGDVVEVEEEEVDVDFQIPLGG